MESSLWTIALVYWVFVFCLMLMLDILEVLGIKKAVEYTPFGMIVLALLGFPGFLAAIAGSFVVRVSVITILFFKKVSDNPNYFLKSLTLFRFKDS